MGNRRLTDREIKRIKKLNLSPEVEQAVQAQWSKEKPTSISVWTIILKWVIGWVMTPVLSAAFAIAVFEPHLIWAKFENVALLIIWLIFIILMPIVTFVVAYVVDEKTEVSPLGQLALGYWKRNRLISTHNTFLRIALVVLLAMSNHMITAVAYIIAMVLTTAFIKKLREAVDKAMADVY